MTDAAIKAVVDTAHNLGMKAAAHAHGTTPIDHAAAIGVDSIEHGTFMVPTLIASATVGEFATRHPELLSSSVAAKALAIGPRMSPNAYDSWKAGVRIAFGTDAGVYQHGQNACEFQLMTAAGIRAMVAIQAATSGAAELIGDAVDIGAIQPGRFADLIATTGDPLADVTELQRVGLVMQGGRIVKQDARAID